MANATRIVTGTARLSYAHLTQPYAQNGQEPKYSTTILIPKSDIATKQRIDAAIEAAIRKGVEKQKWGSGRPAGLKIPVYDGDGVRPSDQQPYGPECKGHWVFTASSKSAPEIVDASMNPIINQTEVYSGMYARVSIEFFPYANSGNKGIGCGLGNVMKVQDGEALGGVRANANDDFADIIAAGMPASAPATYAQPMAPQYPQQAVNPMTGLPMAVNG